MGVTVDEDEVDFAKPGENVEVRVRGGSAVIVFIASLWVVVLLVSVCML